MGKNGSGKSTFDKVLVGHPDYEVTGGSVVFKGQDLLEMEADERSLAGLFMSFQSPVEIPGVSDAVRKGASPSRIWGSDFHIRRSLILERRGRQKGISVNKKNLRWTVISFNNFRGDRQNLGGLEEREFGEKG